MDCRSDVYRSVELLLSWSQSDMFTNDVFAGSDVREAHHHGTGLLVPDICIQLACSPLWAAVASDDYDV